MPTTHLPLGQVTVTPGVLEHLGGKLRATLTLGPFLGRHSIGDWGDVSEEDALRNDEDMLRRARVLSSYVVCGEKLWIITEADRSRTTVLFPSEY